MLVASRHYSRCSFYTKFRILSLRAQLDCFKDKSSSMRQHVPMISIGLHAAALIDDPDDPLPPLLLVSSCLGVTLSRRAKHRHISFLNALMFLQRYADRRGEGFLAEICYNYGRFFHGLSLFPPRGHSMLRANHVSAASARSAHVQRHR